ncbi:DNA polymerase-3 subunit epsilon [Saccharothrix carnea]|uniref:DNA polymerase-3 subunit epsilon n=1 Tax=Saccharothrix carnea TaxID=1280637 RepID=A0A2P8HYV3_SACCR|nr:3'-5' exonuclease [Saccharothrix carnea]PSL51408.1 DNA polymerase-3 subunit epsilon [Saccharothrix carnea]
MTTPPPAAPLPAALQGHPLAVVDVEGNGGRPPEIVEIAVLPVDGPVMGGDLRTWLVRPATPITAFARRIHGIGNDDVERKPPWHGVAREVERLLTGRTLVAHNASTDYAVLSAHLPGWRPPMVLDTLKLARHVWPELPGHSLDKLVAHIGLDTGGIGEQRPHRAGYDTWCAWHLFRTLVDRSGLGWDDLVATAALTAFRPDPEPEGGLW